MMRSAETVERSSMEPIGRASRHLPWTSQRCVAALAMIGVGVMIGGAVSDAKAQAVPAAQLPLEPMTDAEAVGVGCALVAGSVGIATIAAGGAAFIAAEVGVGAASTAVAVPVVVATMAGGCTLGAMATPAFLWVKRQGYTLGSGMVALLPNAAK